MEPAEESAPGEVDVGADASGNGGAYAPEAGLPAEVAAQVAGCEGDRQSLAEQVHKKEAVQAEGRAVKATEAPLTPMSRPRPSGRSPTRSGGACLAIGDR